MTVGMPLGFDDGMNDGIAVGMALGVLCWIGRRHSCGCTRWHCSRGTVALGFAVGIVEGMAVGIFVTWTCG